MKIKELHIYGFGKLEDTTIHIEGPLHFITGDNEAGKSTIRAFIQAVLFGFPSKNEKELSYEPMRASSYGGKMTIQMDDGQQVTIERIRKHRAAGDVAIYLENGNSYGEEWLHTYLHPLDRNMFQGIFSFGLDGLSQLHQLKGADLNQYIYEAGVTGTRKVFQLEKALETQLDRLFKPKGQKPIINAKLKELKERRLELREWEVEFDRYNEWLTEKDQLEKELGRIKKEKRILQKEKERFYRKQTLAQLFFEKSQTERILNDVATSPKLPVEEEEKYKEWSQRIKDCRDMLDDITAHLYRMITNCQGAQVNGVLFINKERIYELKDKLPLYRKLTDDRRRTQLLIKTKTTEAHALLNKLDGNEDELAQAKTSIAAEQELLNLEERGKELRDRIRTLEEQKEQEERELEWVNKEILDGERKTKEIDPVLTKREEGTKERQRLSFLLQMPASAFLAIGIWEIIKGTFSVGLVLLLLGVLVFVVEYWHKKSQPHMEGDEGWDLTTMLKERQWQRDRLLNRVAVLKDSLRENNERWAELEREWEEWIKRNHFPWVVSISSASYHFQQVKKWKSIMHDICMLKWEENTICDSIAEIEYKVESLATSVHIEQGHTVESTVARLVEKCEDEVQNNQVYLEKAKQLKNLYTKKADVHTRMYGAQKKINVIFEKYGIADSEDVKAAISSRQQYEQYKEKERWLLQQIEQHVLPGETKEEWEAELTKWDHQEEWEERDVEELTKEEEKLYNFLAETNQKIEHLEASGTYDRTLQTYEAEKVSLHMDAEQWLVLSTARKMIHEAKAIYEKERQPHVIKKASEYFSFITSGEGRSVLAPTGEETFVVEDKKGNRFSPKELSRGTAEQLYLSLRLALAESITSSERIPFILDDPFVNFDEKRKRAAFSLLEKFAERRQIIYFTCHSLPEHLQATVNVTKL